MTTTACPHRWLTAAGDQRDTCGVCALHAVDWIATLSQRLVAVERAHDRLIHCIDKPFVDESCDACISCLQQRLAAAENDLHAYRGSLGYPCPGDHDGRLMDGTIPENGIANALHQQLAAAEQDRDGQEGAYIQAARENGELRADLQRVRGALAHGIFWLLRAYESGHRQGWEPGPSTKETMDGLFNWLCNQGFDPTKKKTPVFVPEITAALTGPATGE